MRISLLFALLLSSLPAILPAQTAVDRYRSAAKVLEHHKWEYDFLHDDSPEAVAALKSMWAASADLVVQLLTDHPAATSADIWNALCQLDSKSTDCETPPTGTAGVVQLGPQLFLVSDFSSEVGTVFVVGPRDGKPALLWSIDSAAPQQVDKHGFVGAWRADRAGGSCRDKGTKHKSGQCGGLYSALGLLTPDAKGRPRFYLNAGYSQLIGATVAHQTSVWRWDGDSATLLWIGRYDFMIDQKRGVDFQDGILSIGEKDYFRSFFSCGSCEEKQILKRLRITPTGVEELGKISTTPELDLIDELFYRLAHGQPTRDIAASQVVQVLRVPILDAKRESRKTARNWFSTGMLGDLAYERHGGIEQVCFTADDIGRLYFTVKLTESKPVFIARVEQPSGNYNDCTKSEEGRSK